MGEYTKRAVDVLEVNKSRYPQPFQTSPRRQYRLYLDYKSPRGPGAEAYFRRMSVDPVVC